MGTVPLTREEGPRQPEARQCPCPQWAACSGAGRGRGGPGTVRQGGKPSGAVGPLGLQECERECGVVWAALGQVRAGDRGRRREGGSFSPTPDSGPCKGWTGAGPAGQSWALGPRGPARGFLFSGTWLAALARWLLGQDLGGEAVEKAGVLTPTQGQGKGTRPRSHVGDWHLSLVLPTVLSHSRSPWGAPRPQGWPCWARAARPWPKPSAQPQTSGVWVDDAVGDLRLTHSTDACCPSCGQQV